MRILLIATICCITLSCKKRNVSSDIKDNPSDRKIIDTYANRPDIKFSSDKITPRDHSAFLSEQPTLKNGKWERTKQAGLLAVSEWLGLYTGSQRYLVFMGRGAEYLYDLAIILAHEKH